MRLLRDPGATPPQTTGSNIASFAYGPGPDNPASMKMPRDRHPGENRFMQRALELAAEAAVAGEVPVGAVLAQGDECLAEGRNSQIGDADPTAHAEIKALRAAARRLDNYRLPGTTLYVTLEPCSMCCGALVHARVDTLVFAALEPRAGAVISSRALLDDATLNHHVTWLHAPQWQAASGELLRRFFRQRR